MLTQFWYHYDLEIQRVTAIIEIFSQKLYNNIWNLRQVLCYCKTNLSCKCWVEYGSLVVLYFLSLTRSMWWTEIFLVGQFDTNNCQLWHFGNKLGFLFLKYKSMHILNFILMLERFSKFTISFRSWMMLSHDKLFKFYYYQIEV